MSQVIKGLENREKEISGFYYDIQKSNPLQRVTLHANTKPPTKDYDSWPSWSTTSGVNGNFSLINEKDLDPDESGDNAYGAVPICSSILQEDFNVSIANTWGDFVGGQQLEGLWSQLKAFEPYAKFTSDNFSELGNNLSGYMDRNPDALLNKITTAGDVRGFFNKASDISGKISNVLSRQLVVQGTRFKYYAGTGIAFGNLSMRFTLFADHVPQLVYDKTNKKLNIGGYKFQTVDEQLSPLLPYAIGKFVNLLDGEKGSSAATAILGNDIVENSKEIINKWLGWQMTPGGFRADLQQIDKVQKGTLMLKIGPFYRLKNLVIQDIQLNYSKQVAKYVVKDGGKPKLKTCPLYCDVNITLSPAGKYSNNMLGEFVMGRSSDNSAHIKQIEKDVNDSLKDK